MGCRDIKAARVHKTEYTRGHRLIEKELQRSMYMYKETTKAEERVRWKDER